MFQFPFDAGYNLAHNKIDIKLFSSLSLRGSGLTLRTSKIKDTARVVRTF